MIFPLHPGGIETVVSPPEIGSSGRSLGLELSGKGADLAGKVRLVSAGWIAQMLAPSPGNANFGWNVWRGAPYNPKRTYGPGIPAVIESRAPFARDDTYYLDGSGGQRVYVIPSEELVIVRIGQPRSDWDDSQLPNMVVKLVGSPPVAAGKAKGRY